MGKQKQQRRQPRQAGKQVNDSKWLKRSWKVTTGHEAGETGAEGGRESEGNQAGGRGKLQAAVDWKFSARKCCKKFQLPFAAAEEMFQKTNANGNEWSQFCFSFQDIGGDGKAKVRRIPE